MSRKGKEPTTISPKLLGVLVVILALISLGLAIFQVGINVGKVEQAQDSQENSNISVNKSTPLPPEATTVTSRTGIVVDINNNNLQISATIRKGDTFEDTTLTILTTDSTIFSALKTSPIPGKVSDEERLTEITLQDIQIGNTVMAEAATNIKDSLEFEAVSLRRIDRI